MLNRRMPNGMYGGVRGERKSPLLDSEAGIILLNSLLFRPLCRQQQEQHGLL